MIIKCDFCDNILSKKGAILLGPPSENIHKVMDIDHDADVCRKFHLCQECYEKIITDMKISKEIREWKPRTSI